MLRILFSYFIVAMILLGGCKKYAEGGKVGGFTGTDQRIAGDYEIISFAVNGNDSLTALTSHPGYCAGLKIKFERNQGGTNIVKPSCGTYPSNSWRVTDDRKQVEITCSSTTGATSLSAILSNQNLMLPWDIQKLTKEEFWITTTYDNNSYYLKLKK
jgi:hypothetical protein